MADLASDVSTTEQSTTSIHDLKSESALSMEPALDAVVQPASPTDLPVGPPISSSESSNIPSLGDLATVAVEQSDVSASGFISTDGSAPGGLTANESATTGHQIEFDSDALPVLPEIDIKPACEFTNEPQLYESEERQLPAALKYDSECEEPVSTVTEISTMAPASALNIDMATLVPLPMSPMQAPSSPPASTSLGAAAQSSSSSASSVTFVHQIKTVSYRGKKCSVVTQNENGPCPLIALINVLVLRGKVSLPVGVEVVSADELVQMVANQILESAPQNIPSGQMLNYEQNMSDAMVILPKLQTGLDVNVKFYSVREFEYTPECIIFDLLNIVLYHGWLVDPECPEVQAAVSTLSYNQLVEKVITDRNSPDSNRVTEALLIEQFLERSASQLTYHGLCELNASMQEDELAVMFRNNHFSTIHKHKNELFVLVTDAGFLNESRVVWETLSNIDGDAVFVDCDFATVPPRPSPSPVELFMPLDENVTADQQIDQDFQVALSMQEEQDKLQQKEKEWSEFKDSQLGAEQNMTDEELARFLQQQEEAGAAAVGQQDAGASGGDTRERGGDTSQKANGESSTKKKNNCSIL